MVLDFVLRFYCEYYFVNAFTFVVLVLNVGFGFDICLEYFIYYMYVNGVLNVL